MRLNNLKDIYNKIVKKKLERKPELKKGVNKYGNPKD